MKTPSPVDDTILKQMVDAYEHHPDGRPLFCRDMNALRKLPRLEVAIQNVRFSPINGKRYGHQWPIRDDTLREAEAKLQDAKEEIRTARDFDELHDIVQRETGGLPGIGDLAVYDFALRMGAFRRKEPKRVYLHAGSAEGARLLGFEGPTVDPEEFQEPIRRLKSAGIEDFLCRLATAVKDTASKGLKARLRELWINNGSHASTQKTSRGAVLPRKAD